MVDLQPAVELLSARGQQLDIFKEEMREIVRREVVRSEDQDINGVFSIAKFGLLFPLELAWFLTLQ